jgi:hypothetical protein
LLPTEAVGVELREFAAGGGFGLAALQVQRGRVTNPGGGAKYGRGHRKDEKTGEDERRFEDGKGEDSFGGDEGLHSEAALPGDGAGGEKHWIDGGEIVVLGVQDEHEHVEDDEGQTDPEAAGHRAGAQQGDETGDPEQSVGGVHLQELREEEAYRTEDDVLVPNLAVVEELQCRPAVVNLPEHVGQHDNDDECDGECGPACEEDAALWCKQKAESDGDEEEEDRRFVEQADAGGESEDGPPEGCGAPSTRRISASAQSIQKTGSKEFMERKLSTAM